MSLRSHKGMEAMVRSLGALLIAGAVVLFLMPGCGPQKRTHSSHDVPVVRVQLVGSVDKVTITAQQPPLFTTTSNPSPRRLGLEAGEPAVLTLSSNGWLVNGVSIGTGVLTITPAVEGSVAIDRRAFRGSFRFVPDNGGRFDVVNDVDVESYLMGVVAREMLPGWHIEAYKAQAIIARTYALYEVKTNDSPRAFDVFDDERSQVYGGISGESALSVSAVEQTRGQVVAYNGKIFHAYFSSCCGGVSQSVADFAKDTPIPPLEAKYNGASCAMSTKYNWGPLSLSKSEIARRLHAWGERSGRAERNIQAVVSVEIAATNQFGRPRRFQVADARGQAYSLTAEEFRYAINSQANGGPTLPSSFFRPIDRGEMIEIVDGHGFGHGVGACQWCMQAKALAGIDAISIVRSQYPQTAVVAAY